MTINLGAAEAIIERARAHATSIDVPMNIAVTDGGGHLLAFGVQDGRLAEHRDIWEKRPPRPIAQWTADVRRQVSGRAATGDGYGE
jgi:Haem-degrading